MRLPSSHATFAEVEANDQPDSSLLMEVAVPDLNLIK
jgi:hypothetical protein